MRYGVVVLYAVMSIIRTGALPAFPGAEGFGAGAAGARGMNAGVRHVTSTADNGPGTFRDAVETPGAAYVVFDVSGYVDLNGQVDVTADKTIEGATAPGDGIVFRRARLHLTGDNVVIRGVRVWPGNAPGGQDLGSRDGITVGKSAADTVRGVIVANCSVMFSTDEGMGNWYPSNGVTFQDNICAWALRNAGHPEGEHSMGSLISNGAGRFSVTGNLFAFNAHRNPQVTDAWNVEVVNNLVYGYGDNGTQFTGGSTGHAIANCYKPVAGSTVREIKIRDGGRAYARDNIVDDGSAATVDPDSASTREDDPIFTGAVLPYAAAAVESTVLAAAGPAVRTVFESTLVAYVRLREGAIIDSVNDLGGYPVLAAGAVPADGDSDGMPDSWEQSHCGGDCAPAGDHDGDGYENIEEYFHAFYGPGAGVSPVRSDRPGADPALTASPGIEFFDTQGRLVYLGGAECSGVRPVSRIVRGILPPGVYLVRTGTGISSMVLTE